MHSTFLRTSFPILLICLLVKEAFGQSVSEPGIAVTDPLVKEKCGSCHPSDERGNMQRISWERATPEGWQEALRRMRLVYDLELTPDQSRSILQYLSTNHGFAPDETKPLRDDLERRIREQTGVPEQFTRACGGCHRLSRVFAWRRSADDWKELIDRHVNRYNVPPNPDALAFLNKNIPLHTPEWDAWGTRLPRPSPLGRWLVTANLPGRGTYLGEMNVNEDFTTKVTLQSVRDGSRLTRAGTGILYGGHSWRGTSKGAGGASPNDPASEAREVMWISSDASKATGRWFWGEYQEFGFDVVLQRSIAGSILLAVDRASLKAGAKGYRIRLLGEKFPARVSVSDISLGPGVTVRRIVSSSPDEISAEVDVAADAVPGKRDVVLGRSMLPGAIAIYDRVDYIKVTPESALAGFSDESRAAGYQPFEAVGFHRGPDGKRRTDDDVDLGPVDVTWSLKVFYEADGSRTDFVGEVGASGLFTPASKSGNNNFDVWVVAKATSELDNNGKPLVGKSYLVVTIPYYTFRGRRYTRDLDRWVEEGPAQR